MPTVDHPNVFTRAPCAALRPFVQRLLVIEFPTAVKDSHLPDTGLLAAFPFRGECRIDPGVKAPRAVLTGLCDRLRHHAHSAGSAVAVVIFTPLGAAAFLPHPLDELANQSVAMEHVLADSAALARLDERLGEAPDHSRRVRLLEDFLLAQLKTVSPDPLVAAAVAWIESAPPAARIEELVRHIGLSQSALERRFRRVVGAPPKRFASLVRLRNIIRLRTAGGTLTTIAHAAGYFDQSHFIHDFKKVTGLAPESYFARLPVM